MSKFKKCLSQGKKYELETLNYFKYDTYKIMEGNYKEYDIILNDNIKIEVKSERNAFKYGNFAIEKTYYGKPSGIDNTTAHYWVHYAILSNSKYECYIFPIDDLKKLIKSCRIVSGGDNMASTMYLLPLTKCQNYKISTSSTLILS
jgi:hypothetical protein